MAGTYSGDGENPFKFCAQVSSILSAVAFEAAVKTTDGLRFKGNTRNKTWTTYTTTFKPSAKVRQFKQDVVAKKQIGNLLKLMNEPSSLLDVDGGNVSWTTYSTNFKPSAKVRQAKQNSVKKKQVDNLIKFMNVNNHDDSSSVEDVEGAEDAENAAESDDESVSLLEVGGGAKSKGNQTWTATLATNFKPSAGERQAKQDVVAKKQIGNLLRLMNEPSSSLLDVNGGNVSWTTYSTNFKPTQETRQAKQDLNKKNQVDNLVKYMNQK